MVILPHMCHKHLSREWIGTIFAYCVLFQIGTLVSISAADVIRPLSIDPVPAGARLAVETSKQEYLLGENVLLRVRLFNDGHEAFQANTGGDYRGAGRALRFSVSAKDEFGKESECPNPEPMCFGGMIRSDKVEPGKSLDGWLELSVYRRINHSGRYTIQVSHDFGWKENEDRKWPVASMTLLFREPTLEEAERVIAHMDTLVGHPVSEKDVLQDWKLKELPAYDFLERPVYIEPLLRRAKTGNAQALTGIGRIADPAATLALIELAGSTSPMAMDAANALIEHLPVPEGSPSHYGWLIRQRLSTLSWKPGFAPSVRAMAKILLGSSKPEQVAIGARFIQGAGESEDAPAVLNAMVHAMEPLMSPRQLSSDNLLNLPSPMMELMSAMTELRHRGYDLDKSLSGNAEILLYFEWRAKDRPTGWIESLDAFGQASPYPIREAAVRSMVPPIPMEARRFIIRGLADQDLGVIRAACEVAGASSDRTLLQPVLDIIATEHHEWLLRSACTAAQALGGRYEVMVIMADRMAENGMLGLAFDQFQTIIDMKLHGWSGVGGNMDRAARLALRGRWQTFLAQHADVLRQGLKFKLDDVRLDATLFSSVRQFSLPTGGEWPTVPTP